MYVKSATKFNVLKLNVVVIRRRLDGKKNC